MAKIVRLWMIWLSSLATGIFGTSLIYHALFNGIVVDWLYGIPILFLGIWITGNMWASARQLHYRNRSRHLLK